MADSNTEAVNPAGASADVSSAPDFDSAVDASAAKAAAAAPAAEEAPASSEGDSPAADEGTAPPPLAAPVTEEELEPGDELKPDRVADDGKTLHFSKKKAERLMAARNAIDQIAA